MTYLRSGPRYTLIDTTLSRLQTCEFYPVLCFHTVSDAFVRRMGDDWSFVLGSYGEHWRKRRKIFQQNIGIGAVRDFDTHITEHVGDFLGRLKATPNHMFEHTRW